MAYCFSPVRLCVCVSVHLCVHLETLLARYLAVNLTHFYEITSAMHYGTEMNVSQFGAEVKVMDGGIKYAGNSTF